MARPTFSPNDEQRRTLAALVRLAERRAAYNARVDAEMDKLIDQAAKLGVPVNHIADSAKVQRKTVYRHLGRKMK